ncbi:MAG: Permease of the major facilitator superfamily [Citricoccus sp.]|nr:Permease of the major facilitator superfamily [Citricoccus sp. WCRC_4]
MSAQNPVTRGSSALLGLMWIALWGFSGFFLSYSTMVPISVERGLSPVAGGALLLVMMLSVIAVQPAAPALQRRLGPRRAIGGSLLLMAAGHGAAVLVPDPAVGLLVMGVAVGCGFGVLVVLATAAVPAVTSPERVGRALGRFGATTAAAAAAGAPLGLWLSAQVPPEAFRGFAAAAVLLALPAMRLIPSRSTVPETRPSALPTQGEDRASGSFWAALAPVLLPFLVSMCAYGLVIAFGPGGDTTHPALFIATMQASAVVSRWVAGALTDRGSPGTVYTVGIVMTVLGLVSVALVPPGWALAACLVLMGLGVGAVQSASLVLAFARAGSRGQASVGWNMTFDSGLGLAGLFGGLGFTFLGSGPTFAGVAGLLLAASLPLWLRRRRPVGAGAFRGAFSQNSWPTATE